ncbi:NUDIX hydrolase [Micromonospora olivasterospora]|uniref:ADP-ribose pyrophosphatase YjhB (NUDIX family) n=1 Tax=Micromonospora olivasterospora TaxID=1880 RepID=A0A562I273_MICOL|nr:NUDIX hydrolase [Micromonospora olivasterospora]TWH65141.1 ADP-ribose pyrophosphatase YjhB (NUDIX family) [Micromonospora olivasterospora]
MTRTPLDEADTEELLRLLGLLRERGGHVPHMPLAIWRALSTLTPQPAVELLVTSDGSDVLCTWREDEHWHGWHLPGGFVGPGESAEQACDRVARRELGFGVDVVGHLGTFAWPDHPYASTLSLLYACRARGGPAALADRRDGSLFRSPPPVLIPHHRAFVDRFLATAPHHAGAQPPPHHAGALPPTPHHADGALPLAPHPSKE